MVDLDAVDMDPARATLHLLPLAGQLVQALSVDLNRGIHRWYLVDFTDHRSHRPADPCLVHLYRTAPDHTASHVLRIRLDTQLHPHTVGLVRVRQHPGNLCRAAQTDGKNPHRGRIKRPRMTDLFLVKDAPHFRHDVVGRKAFLLIYVDDSVQHSRLRFID